MRSMVTVAATLCHVLGKNKLLLKRARRGISKGKWNAPGGKVEQGETPQQNVRREVFEETGLVLGDLFYHGKITYVMGAGEPRRIRVFLFSTDRFRGKPRPTEEGNLRWFAITKLPLGEMWDDDRYWIHLMLNKCRFNAIFRYDLRNRRVREFEIRSVQSRPESQSES
jgi:8-oxo-dGTP diphosphatase